jgi:hypothetical protein
MRSILALLVLVSIGSQLFAVSSATDVFELTDANFDQITAEGKWIVELYVIFSVHIRPRSRFWSSVVFSCFAARSV